MSHVLIIDRSRLHAPMRSSQQLDVAHPARQHARVPDPFRVGRIEIDTAHVGLGKHERVLGPDPCCRIKPRELVDVVKRRPDQVVLEVWFRELDTGVFGRGRKFRRLQRLIVDP